jgi:hypothetical protein
MAIEIVSLVIQGKALRFETTYFTKIAFLGGKW